MRCAGDPLPALGPGDHRHPEDGRRAGDEQLSEQAGQDRVDALGRPADRDAAGLGEVQDDRRVLGGRPLHPGPRPQDDAGGDVTVTEADPQVVTSPETG